MRSKFCSQKSAVSHINESEALEFAAKRYKKLLGKGMF